MPAAAAARRARVGMDGEVVAGPSRKSWSQVLTSRNSYVTVMKRSDDTEPVQITLDPVFDVESDGGLENGCSLRRFRAMLIRNFQVAGGSK